MVIETPLPPPPAGSQWESLTKYPKEDVIDGCTAAAHVAYACSDASFIYPITPSSPMAETYELWAVQERKNIFGQTCAVKQLQSEAGAAGAVHGSLCAGAITTTFTASQGLLLMIPPMYKIAGELLPCVLHVAARAVAGQALSIFGDHSDVMAVRQCGWALLSSASVQEAQDMALICHMATLTTKVPFIHFFDGFRTSHEVQKISIMDYWTIKQLIEEDSVQKFRERSLNPTHPYTKGASQGPEVYFQNVEVANRYYQNAPALIEDAMASFAKVTGRKFEFFEYYGSQTAEDLLVIIGAGGPVIGEVIDYLKDKQGNESVGLITVKVYRPWVAEKFLAAVPKSIKRVCVLDRTKEPGALGEPLFLDVAATFQSSDRQVRCIGGRYGLGSKDFTPAMILAVIKNIHSETPKHGFTVGITDDITNTSLFVEPFNISTVPAGTTECMFWGMGSDGTVGANKNVIKIIGTQTPLKVQGYFAYSAHKAGGITISHLRFGPQPIRSQYLIQQADYVAVHRPVYISKYNCHEYVRQGGIFVLNTNWTAEELESNIPGRVKRSLAERGAKFFVIDANKVAAENGMGRRINNVLMTSFFKLSGVLPFEDAIALFKNAIQKTYGKKGKHVVEANWKCVDAAAGATSEYVYDAEAWKQAPLDAAPKQFRNSAAIAEPPTFVQGVMLALERMQGDELPTSAFAEFEGGVIPPGSAGYEKRAIALNIPIVDMDKCTQCNHCAFVCPHAAIRPFLMEPDDLEKAPEQFTSKKSKGQGTQQFYYRIQVAPYDCTGCELCAIACPDDALTMTALEQVDTVENVNWDYAIQLKDRSDHIGPDQRVTLKGSQFYTPMVEFSGACEGCGETPYVKLLTQLFGERLIIANATGCSSIWGASYPANAYTVNQKGYGPAWGNSLFEDNAEYGYGMAIATSQRREKLRADVEQALTECADLMSTELRSHLSEWLLEWTTAEVCQRVFEAVKDIIVQESSKHQLIKNIACNRDLLPRISQWIVGGDGWAYDIGFGGLDHVIASGVDVNILVLDTEVYSNTGGQASKATVLGAVAKFASNGRARNKKDLGAICIEYGDVYVASCASSANMTQTVRAFVEAEAYCGTSVIMAYSPCIEHQYIKPFNLQIEHCKLAVDSGYWPLYRYNPALADDGQNPFQLDSKKIKADIIDLVRKENRFGSLKRSHPKIAQELEIKLKTWVHDRFSKLQQRAAGLNAAPAGESGAVDKDAWHILFGTDTGNSEDVAKRIFANMKERDVKCTVAQMDEVEIEDFFKMHRILIVCSTCGQGEHPENSKEFYHALGELVKSNSTDVKHMTYAVMGLGDSSYVKFNEAAKGFDTYLQQLGATRLMPVGLGDDQDEDGYETALAEWLGNFWVEAKIPEPKNVSPEPNPVQFDVEKVQNADLKYNQCVPAGSKVIKLIKNLRLTPDDYDVNIRHLEFDLSGSGIQYGLGDSLAIYPQNKEEDVADFCKYFGYDMAEYVKITPKNPKQCAEKYKVLFKNPITIKQLFLECLDIFGRPNRSFYETLWKYCTDDKEREVAKDILKKENRERLLQWTQKETATYFDILKKFPSTSKKLSVAHFIDLIPLIKVRYYSIASSQRFVGENRLHLCIGIVDWKTADGTIKQGQCTGFIARIQPTETEPVLVCTSIKPTAFNLPPNDKYPIITAGLGTGLAPFRAFIQHRHYLKNSNKPHGPLTVYYGCRYSQKDFLYKDELTDLQEQGVISELVTAFSRDQKEKFYVQHAILRDPKLLYKRLVEEDGYFYLCGSAKQVPIDIRNAVRQVLCAEGNMDDKAADDLITQWQIKGKYNVEAW